MNAEIGPEKKKKWLSPRASFAITLIVSLASVCGLIWIAWTRFEDGPVSSEMIKQTDHWLRIFIALGSALLISMNTYLSWLKYKDAIRTRRDERAGDKKPDAPSDT